MLCAQKGFSLDGICLLLLDQWRLRIGCTRQQCPTALMASLDAKMDNAFHGHSIAILNTTALICLMNRTAVSGREIIVILPPGIHPYIKTFRKIGCFLCL